MCNLMVARKNISIRAQGVIRQGAVRCADDPVVKAHPDAFSQLAVEHHCKGGRNASVEQATAAPGEKRTMSRRRTKTQTHIEEPGEGTAMRFPEDSDD